MAGWVLEEGNLQTYLVRTGCYHCTLIAAGRRGVSQLWENSIFFRSIFRSLLSCAPAFTLLVLLVVVIALTKHLPWSKHSVDF